MGQGAVDLNLLFSDGEVLCKNPGIGGRAWIATMGVDPILSVQSACHDLPVKTKNSTLKGF